MIIIFYSGMLEIWAVISSIVLVFPFGLIIYMMRYPITSLKSS